MLVTLSIVEFLLGRCFASPSMQLLQSFVLSINELNAFYKSFLVRNIKTKIKLTAAQTAEW